MPAIGGHLHLRGIDLSSTVYKQAALPDVGGSSGTWGPILNGSLGTFDSALGQISSISVGSANVSLTSTQAGSAILRVTGTLTASVQLTTSTQGFQVVENMTTGGYTLTITNGVGSAFTLPQGVASLVIFDTVNGARYGHQEFQSGTTTVFYQASAPLFWTQVTTYNDVALRVVSGAGGGSNTSGQAFSAAVATGAVDPHAITQAELPLYNLIVTDPKHAHNYLKPSQLGVSTGGTNYYVNAGIASTDISATGIAVSSGGSNSPHPHTFTSSALGINTIDMILCQRN